MIKHHNKSKYTTEYDIYNNDECYDNKSYDNGVTIYWAINILTIILLSKIPTEITLTYI